MESEMSRVLKIQLSRACLIICMSILIFAALSSVAVAQGITDVKATAEAVAGMNVMQLMAYIMLASIGSNVLIVGFLVRVVTSGQKESAEKMAEIATALHGVAENCNRKVCPR
jgi:ABC-type transport system involved in cytochrome c biogenesis permease subunit